MTDRDVVVAKLAELDDRIARVRANVRGSASELASDRDASDLVAFNLMLAVQTCLDVAGHIIADEGWPPAATLAESFHRLAERGVITAATDAALGVRRLFATSSRTATAVSWRSYCSQPRPMACATSNASRTRSRPG